VQGSPTPPQSGGDNPGVHADVEGRGDEGERAEQASPALSDESNAEQTQVPAPEDDVGVPSDEEMERPEQ
jgi:hypothetical protein